MSFPDVWLHGVSIEDAVGEVARPQWVRPIVWHDLQRGRAVRVAFLELRPQSASEMA